MAEEVKETETKEKESKKILSTLLKVLLGIVFLALGIWAIVVWRYDFLVLVKGCVGPFLLLAALITFAIAKE
ncbi:MAG: hypothetical protein NC936_02400 [Candidatus Omnitrophica bacterium]|nr:hypothetical protein [Candidatus Omnitrophota bacterium]